MFEKLFAIIPLATDNARSNRHHDCSEHLVQNPLDDLRGTAGGDDAGTKPTPAKTDSTAPKSTAMSTCSVRRNLHHAFVTMKRKKGIILLTGAIVVVGLCFVVFGDRESQPEYQGRSLSSWLAVYDDLDPTTFEQAEEAVLHIGTNALPCLLRWIQYEPPAWRASLKGVVPSRIWDNGSFQDFIAGRAGRRAAYARDGFRILGTNAVAALPELEKLMKTNTRPMTVFNAFLSLVSIGQPSLPVFERALADTNQLYRYRIPISLRAMAMEDGPAAYLPLLRQALTNDDRMVRENAATVLKVLETPAE